MSEIQWVFGIHAVGELLRQNPQDVIELLTVKGRDDKRLAEITALATQLGVRQQSVERRVLEQRLNIAGASCGGKHQGPVHQGVAASFKLRSVLREEAFLFSLLDELQRPPLLLVLDGLTDPHNFGACLRSADAAGVDAVIVPRDKSAPVNMTVRKVASGAAETVKLIGVTNLARTLEALRQRGVWIAGAAGEAQQTLYELDLSGPVALVMGSEGKGLRRLTREHCDYLISIPMAGTVGSLNVSVATGVCLFEAVRQRQGRRH